MFIIRAIGLSRPYLQLFREVRTETSHATHWSFTGVRLAARHFPDRPAAAVVKAKLVNLMLCTGRGELARSLRVEPAIPGAEAAEAAVSSSSLLETEPRATEPTGSVKLGKITCALVACVLTLGGCFGCAGPKVVAEAAYRGEARSVEAGELVASIRAEWN